MSQAKSLHLLSRVSSARFSGYDKLLNSIYIICDLHYTDIFMPLSCSHMLLSAVALYLRLLMLLLPVLEELTWREIFCKVYFMHVREEHYKILKVDTKGEAQSETINSLCKARALGCFPSFSLVLCAPRSKQRNLRNKP